MKVNVNTQEQLNLFLNKILDYGIILCIYPYKKLLKAGITVRKNSSGAYVHWKVRHQLYGQRFSRRYFIVFNDFKFS
ncbi:hypothetical protein ACUL41_14740 [Virgibacillus natechei]|uniref:hypothetical protein n=1 Tax=Virgibacillus sp. CBA3643 TaxID=2942278 RepID=UPI0035A3B34D